MLITAVVLAVIACAASGVALYVALRVEIVVEPLRNHSEPDTSALQQQIDALKLGQQDVIDQVGMFTKRWSKRERDAIAQGGDPQEDPQVIHSPGSRAARLADARARLRNRGA